jgi:murein DD-endopeptidase MepM/ murein hydrolase activator NlpD
MDPTGCFWDELGNALRGNGWRKSTEEEKDERRKSREERAGSGGASNSPSSTKKSADPSKPKDELEEELNPGIPPDPEPKLPKDGPTIPENLNFSKVDWVDPLDHMKIRNDLKSNTFGPDVRYNADGTPRAHQGIDLETDIGTDVKAVSEGEIVYINPDKGDYGRYIILKFNKEGETYYAQYAHLSETSVSRGDKVSAGQIIGKTGDTGNAKGMTGCDLHLHFEIRTKLWPGRGVQDRVDPLPFFKVKLEVK